LRGGDAIQSRRIHRTGRPMTAPGAASNFIKLPPIAFLPRAHTNFNAKRLRFPSGSAPAILTSVIRLVARIGCSSLPKGSPLSLPAIPQNRCGTSGRRKTCRSAAPRYCKTQGTGNFPCVMFQTRYCGKSFAKAGGEGAYEMATLRRQQREERQREERSARGTTGDGIKAKL
jgi:hypothetical protein